MSSLDPFKKLAEHRIVAVLTLEDVATAEPVAAALLAGGVQAVELTLRTDAAIDCLRAMHLSAPAMTIGAGTVLTPRQLDQAIEAGASFAVSPGVNPRVLEAARKSQFPFAPGVATPTDIELALEYDCRLMKLFPAGPLGGLGYLRSIAAPYQHLGVCFIPLGGVSQENLAEYLAEPLVAAVGGSWLAPPAVIAAGNWADIERRAKLATNELSRATPPQGNSGT